MLLNWLAILYQWKISLPKQKQPNTKTIPNNAFGFKATPFLPPSSESAFSFNFFVLSLSLFFSSTSLLSRCLLDKCPAVRFPDQRAAKQAPRTNELSSAKRKKKEWKIWGARTREAVKHKRISSIFLPLSLPCRQNLSDKCSLTHCGDHRHKTKLYVASSLVSDMYRRSN